MTVTESQQGFIPILQHKYDFLYKVLDSTALEAQHRKSRARRDDAARPKTSVKSPEKTKSTRKSSERVKSSLVRSSMSPKRERRTARRVISPGPSDKRRGESRSAVTRTDGRTDKTGRGYPRSDPTPFQDDAQVTQSEHLDIHNIDLKVAAINILESSTSKLISSGIILYHREV
ncbi:hypothetical protein MAR_005929 [Mya arenaria]|uniref:Uncharacterized protein n=1 Tax=Mya arenaria TaxID=6604 RepID=A0ABY7D936_MYAAR|nr:hypothetical protein MAR_005929 [Mya arenaria]